MKYLKEFKSIKKKQKKKKNLEQKIFYMKKVINQEELSIMRNIIEQESIIFRVKLWNYSKKIMN